jgi:hypothetical protein
MRCCLVGVAIALLMQGCAESSSTSPSTDATTTPSVATTTTTTQPASTSSLTAAAVSTTVAPTTTLAPTTTPVTTLPPTTTTLGPTTTTEPPATTEPPDTGTVDIAGYVVHPTALDVVYIVINNTNHGIMNPQVHLDFLDAAGQIIGSQDATALTKLAPGDFAVDRVVVSNLPGVHDPQAALHDAHITVVSAAKIKLPRSPITVEDLRTVPAAGVAGGGTVALGTLVNESDVDQDIAPVHALALDPFGRADPFGLPEPIWLVRMKAGERVPFSLHTQMPDVPPDRFKISITSTASPPPAAVQISVSPLTAFIGPTSEGGGPEYDNLEVVGELTNNGSKAFAAPQWSALCLVRDQNGTIIDMSPVLSWSNRGAGEFSVELQTDVEPGATVPFACGDFNAVMATSLPTDIGAYTIDVLGAPDAFTDASPRPGRVETPSTFSASFIGNEAYIAVTFTNTQPDPATAGEQVRVYDSTTGRLLSFAGQTFIEVVNGNGVYNIAPGATKSPVVVVNLPPGTNPNSLRIESTAELTPGFTG